jgi:hypothetical protein
MHLVVVRPLCYLAATVTTGGTRPQDQDRTMMRIGHDKTPAFRACPAVRALLVLPVA